MVAHADVAHRKAAVAVTNDAARPQRHGNPVDGDAVDGGRRDEADDAVFMAAAGAAAVLALVVLVAAATVAAVAVPAAAVAVPVPLAIAPPGQGAELVGARCRRNRAAVVGGQDAA